ncbi:MAG: chalcone isomerase family protein [Burkholderiaceae bacterium]
MDTRIASICNSISSKGSTIGEPFKEPEFFYALASIWLGKSPADWQLKESMPGQKKPAG